MRRAVTPSPSSSCSAPRSCLAAARRGLPRSSHPLPPIRPPRSSRRSRRRRNPLPHRPRRRSSCAGAGRADVEIQPAAVDTTTEVGGAAAETLDPAAPEVLSSSDTAAFAQDVPAPGGSRLGAHAQPAKTREMMRPHRPQHIVRPPPPPDPGTGLSTIVDRGTNGRLEVALTFDAGADTGYAAEILDLLRDEGIKATFGMTGVWAEANPELVQRMAAEGHQLINHTWDHSSLTGANTQMPPMTPEQVAQQLADTEAVVRDLTVATRCAPISGRPTAIMTRRRSAISTTTGTPEPSGGPATPAAGPAGAPKRSSTTARPTSPKTRSCSCMSAPRPSAISKRCLG